MSKIPCRDCGHSEDDHDGYGGLCDGLGFNASRTVCGCQEYRAPAADSRDLCEVVPLSAEERIYISRIFELRAEIDTLTARVVRAECDTARLDWLDSGPMSVVPAWGADGSRIGVVAQDGRKDGKTRRAGSVRAAIDAARCQGTRKPKRAPRPATP